jgi:hypothetical protein
MTKTICSIAVLLLLGCDTKTNTSKFDTISEETKLFVYSVLDDVGDTIAKDFSVRMKLALDTTFMGPVPHVISYNQFEKIDSLIVQEDMATISRVNGVRCVGEFVRLKHKIEISGSQKFKANYVQDLDWTKVNANQVNCCFVNWGNSGSELDKAIEVACDQGKSLAEFYWNWNEENKRDINFFELATDSLFRKGWSASNQYFITWNEKEEDAFHIIDEGIISDLNGDGIADRLLKYRKQGAAGVCGVTRREREGRLLMPDLA